MPASFATSPYLRTAVPVAGATASSFHSSRCAASTLQLQRYIVRFLLKAHRAKCSLSFVFTHMSHRFVAGSSVGDSYGYGARRGLGLDTGKVSGGCATSRSPPWAPALLVSAPVLVTFRSHPDFFHSVFRGSGCWFPAHLSFNHVGVFPFPTWGLMSGSTHSFNLSSTFLGYSDPVSDSWESLPALRDPSPLVIPAFSLLDSFGQIMVLVRSDAHFCNSTSSGQFLEFVVSLAWCIYVTTGFGQFSVLVSSFPCASLLPPLSVKGS